MKIFLTILFYGALSWAAPAKASLDWRKEFLLKAPIGWKIFSIWKGKAPMVRWEGERSGIVVQKFTAASPLPTPERFLSSRFIADHKGRKPKFLKNTETKAGSARLFKRTYEMRELEEEAVDLPLRVKDQYMLKEEMVILERKDYFYVLRYYAPPSKFRENYAAWQACLASFKLAN